MILRDFTTFTLIYVFNITYYIRNFMTYNFKLKKDPCLSEPGRDLTREASGINGFSTSSSSTSGWIGLNVKSAIIRSFVLSTSESRSGDEWLFGGFVQNVEPVDNRLEQGLCILRYNF